MARIAATRVNIVVSPSAVSRARSVLTAVLVALRIAVPSNAEMMAAETVVGNVPKASSVVKTASVNLWSQIAAMERATTN